MILEAEETRLEPKRLVLAELARREQRVAGGRRRRRWRWGIRRRGKSRQLERVVVPMKHRRPVGHAEDHRLGAAGKRKRHRCPAEFGKQHGWFGRWRRLLSMWDMR